MAFGQEKIKEFFEEEAEKITNKIERTPMEKFFVFFLILISVAAVIMGYLQFKKNIDQPLFSSYIRDASSDLRDKYLTPIENSNLNSLGYIPNSLANLNENLNTLANLNQGGNLLNLNEPIDLTNQDSLMQLEAKLLSGEITLQQLGIDDPELQKAFDQIRTMQPQNTNALSLAEQTAALEGLKNMSPAELRQELLNQGVDQATLDQIDDQTLKKFLEETIKTYQ